MRKQRSPCTILPSHHSLSERELSSPDSFIDESQWIGFSSFWSQFEAADSDQISNTYFDSYESGGPAFNHVPPNMYHHSFGSAQPPHGFQVLNENPVICNSWPPAEPHYPFQYSNENCDFPDINGIQYTTNETISPPILLCGIPTVTSYGAVAILLRHLIRVDITCNGSVSLYNFPAISVTSLSASGGKCYVQHPNGRVYQDGSGVHMLTANSRYAKITEKGVFFSPTPQGLSYVIDESGTKTTSAKFTSLGDDLVASVFYDENRLSYERLQEESYKMAVETRYQSYPNGCESWLIGSVRIKQDKWGEVTVTQRNNERRTIIASPTIRRATVELPELKVNIDCYSKNYFSVRKGSSSVSSGFCGLIVQNKSQKAGIDRLGRLVLF